MLVVFFILFTVLFLVSLSFFVRNVVYLVFILLFVFVCMSSIIFLFSDFLGLLFLLVYSGGLAVLFLFVSFTITVQKQGPNTVRQSLSNFLLAAILYIKSVVYFLFLDFNYYFVLTKFDLNLFLFNIDQFSEALFFDRPVLIVIIALILLSTLLGSISCFRQDLITKPGTNRF